MEHKEFWQIWCKHAKQAPILTQRKFDRKMLIIMKIIDRVSPFIKTSTLFQLLPSLYKGGEFQPWTRLLISFNHEFRFLMD